MKLLLTSNGLTSAPLERSFLEMTNGDTHLRVVYISTAADPIEWVPESEGSKKYTAKVVGENKAETFDDYRYYKERGYDIVIADLKGDRKALEAKLRHADIIHACGGDANYLLDWGKMSGLDAYLKDILNSGVVYVGVSAGSCLLLPDIGLTWWEEGDPTDHVGFGIVDFLVAVHQKDDDAQKNPNKLLERRKYLQSVMDYPWRIYLVKDGQAIKVDGDKVEHIGPGVKKHL